MSEFASFLCQSYRDGILTETQVTRYYTRRKITAGELACILDPACSCEWPAFTAQQEPAAE